MLFDANIHTPNLSSSINLIITKMNLSDFILTLNCVIKSKWVLNLIWQAYYNLLKICFLNAYCRLNEN